MHHLGIITPTQLLLPLKYIYYNHNQIKRNLTLKKKTFISTTFPPKQAKTQSSSTPVSKQSIPVIKQSTTDQLPNSDKGSFTTKNKYILSEYNKPRMKFHQKGPKARNVSGKSSRIRNSKNLQVRSEAEITIADNNRTGNKQFLQ